MKRLFIALFFILHPSCFTLAQSTGAWALPKKKSTAGFENEYPVVGNSQILGRKADGTAAGFILGSGLTLTGATLSASGGGGGGSSTLAGLTDVSLTSIASGDMLKWNGTAWINRSASQVRTDIGLGSLATLSAIGSTNITDGEIVNADISASAAIALSKLATDPLARANHTGTQTLSTISDAGTFASKNTASVVNMTGGSFVWSTSALIISETGITLPDGDITAAHFDGDGAAITGLNGSNISSGTVADARLSANVSLLGSSIALTSEVTGTLPVANGGTGITSLGTGVASALGNAVNGASGLLTYGLIGTSGTKIPLLDAANTWSGVQSLANATNSATPTALIIAANTQAATLGTQSASPSIRLTGHGWRSGNSTDHTLDSELYLLPIQGTSGDPAHCVILRTRTDGGSWSDVLQITQGVSGISSTNINILTPSGTATLTGASLGSSWSSASLCSGLWTVTAATGTLASSSRGYKLAFGTDVVLTGTAANELSLQNGTNAQTLLVWGTTTGSKNLKLTHDGTNGKITTSSGTLTLDSNSGGVTLPPVTAPSAPASGWTIYVDSGDSNKLKAKASNGTVVTLGTP